MAVAAAACLGATLGCNQPRYERPDALRGDAGQLIPVASQAEGADAGPLPDVATGPLPLSVALMGTGSGTVTARPGGMCTATCASMLPRGTTVVLTAQPTPPSVFAGWSGACSGQGGCTVVMDAPRDLVARFDLPGLVWVQDLPPSTALLAAEDGVLVGGAATGSQPVGDRTFEGGTFSTPFFAKFGADGKVQELKSYLPGSVSFGAISAIDGTHLNVAGFVGNSMGGGGTVKLARLTHAGELLAAVDRPNVELLWNFGSRVLVLSANNGGLELLDDRGVAVPNTQLPRPFLVADAVTLPDGGWAIGGQFVGTLRLGDRTLSSSSGDWVVGRWRPDRSVLWVQTSPADRGARLERMTANPAGDFFIGGIFTGQLQLQSQLFANQGASAFFLARLTATTGNVLWGNAISAPLGVRCTALAASADGVYVALTSPGELTVQGVKVRAPTILIKYDANTGAHARTIPLDGAVASIEIAPDGVYVLGDRLWKLQR